MSGLFSWLPSIGAAPSSETDEPPPLASLPPRAPLMRAFTAAYAYRSEVVVDSAGGPVPIRLPVPTELAPLGPFVTDLTIDWFECRSAPPNFVLRLRLHHADACNTWATDDVRPLTLTFPAAPYSGKLDQCVYRREPSSIAPPVLRALAAIPGEAVSAEVDAARRSLLYAANIGGDLVASSDEPFCARITFYVRTCIVTAQPVR